MNWAVCHGLRRFVRLTVAHLECILKISIVFRCATVKRLKPYAKP
jgi:hypothetical protein